MSLQTMNVAAVSWSGGKDCALALHRARQAGIDVRVLLVMFDETGERTRSHAVPRELMEAQAAALGLDLVARNATWADYERVFIKALGELKERGVETVVFGDIDLDPHREWEERVCAAAGLQPLLPLWKEERRKLADEVLTLGFQAIVVCTDDRWLGPAYCGRAYDAGFLADLPDGVDPCGENGEFHTFVSGGPTFRAPVAVDVIGVESREIAFGNQRYTYHYARLARVQARA